MSLFKWLKSLFVKEEESEPKHLATTEAPANINEVAYKVEPVNVEPPMIEGETTEIMGINIPTTTIPVKPGRNLAIILEIAAMNNRQKKMGYNTAVEFNKKLMGQFDDSLR